MRSGSLFGVGKREKKVLDDDVVDDLMGDLHGELDLLGAENSRIGEEKSRGGIRKNGAARGVICSIILASSEATGG